MSIRLATKLVFMVFAALRLEASQSDYTRIGYFPVVPQPWYFKWPTGLAQDPQGNIYVSNAGVDNRVIKLDPNGRFLRTWTQPYVPGIGMTAEGIAADSNGIVYVLGMFFDRVFKFDGDGIPITSWTIAPQVNTKSIEGHIGVDPQGRVYVSDDMTVLARYDSNGSFLGFVGSGYGSGDGQIAGPGQTAFDQSGNVYVVDQGNWRIDKFTSTGAYVMKFGEGILRGPSSVTLDIAGNVYVLDGNDTVVVFDSTGSFQTRWDAGAQPDGKIRLGKALVFGRDGLLYIVDNVNDAVVIFTTNGQFVKKLTATGSASGQFRDLSTVAISPGGDIYVADTGNDRIQKFDKKGKYIRAWGTTGSGDGQFLSPWGVSVSQSDMIFVTDTKNIRVQKFSKDGQFLVKWGSAGFGDGLFVTPRGISVNPPGNVTVSDGGTGRALQRFDENGGFIKWFNNPAGYSDYYGVSVDPSGNVFAANYGKHQVDQFAPDGTFVKTWGRFGTQPGQFGGPEGICTDRSGFVYVADTGNRRIQKFDPAGNFVTAIGPFSDWNDMLWPTGCAVAPNGDLYVADRGARIVIFSRGLRAGKTIAAAASAPGAGGTYWKTDLTIANTGPISATVDSYFWPRNQDNATATPRSFSLEPGETRLFEDLIGSDFSAPGLAGAVPFACDSVDVLLSSRTYTPSAGSSGGTFGQGIPAPSDAALAFPGRSIHLAGLTANDKFRTNVGLINSNESACQVHLDLFNARGSPAGSRDIRLEAHEPIQFDLAKEFGITSAIEDDRMVVDVSELGCFAGAYASIVDNRSGDPVFVPAAEPAGYEPESPTLLIPVVASAPGLGGTLWRSDLVLANVGLEDLEVVLDFFDSKGSSTPIRFTAGPIGAGESIRIDDIVSSRFGEANAIGYLLAAPSGPGLVLTSRTYNDDPAGTYGQNVPAVLLSDLFSINRLARLPGIRRDAAFRTNLGLVNRGAGGVTLTVRLLDASGATLATKGYSLPAQGFAQITDVVRNMGVVAEERLLRADVSIDDPSAAFDAYISIVDNVTGDAVFEAAQ